MIKFERRKLEAIEILQQIGDPIKVSSERAKLGVKYYEDSGQAVLFESLDIMFHGLKGKNP